jgi:hypothetical protein
MPQRGRRCGERWWKLNTRACGVGSAPMRCMGPMWWGYVKTLAGGGGISPDV